MQSFPLTNGLFVQLQSRYPTSSLLTELVQIYDGLFVVKAMVQVGGTAIATGMAAASSIELAEDQARVRVLSFLGIGANNVEMAEASLPQPVPSTNGNGFAPLPTTTSNAWLNPAPSEILSSSSSFPSSGNFTPPQELIDDVPTFDSFDAIDDVPTFDSFDAEENVPDDFGYSDTSLEPVPPPIEPAAIEPEPQPAKPIPAPKSQKTSAKAEKPSPAPAAADDLSSLIALTDVEMDRIGWTKQEGRDYLKRTYGKSTRQRLDEDELLDFLNYLRALPSLSGL